MTTATRAIAPATSAAVLEAEHLACTLDGRPVLRDVSLRVGAGELVAIVGANGAGKSTLLRVLATLTPPTSGTLRLFGKPVDRTSADLRARIGMIGHQLMLYRDLSARENLEFFAKLYDLPDPATRARRMLETVGLWGRRDDAIKTFSRGMAQRVAIARALVHDPGLLLADEPFTGLDAGSTESLEALLKHLSGAAGKTVVLVNHDLTQTLALADRVIALAGGRVALDARADQVTARNLLQEISR